jgi:ectoine hydroxylase-related dioxygenase (phytanoyl-CoA dioxygenase family)
VFTLDRFADTGVLHLPGAFSPGEAGAMADGFWNYLEARCPARRGDPASWPEGHPPPGVSLRGLKAKRVFTPALDNAAVTGALDAVLGRDCWVAPKRGPRVLVTFPTPGPWVMPTAWHMDSGFETPTYPVPWMQLWAVVGPLPPCGGGTLLLAGSHRLVERYRQGLREEERGGNSVSWGRFMRQHPFLDRLRQGGSPENPGRELLGQANDIDGIAVQALEVSGQPGDVYLSHGQVFHCAAPDTSGSPRLMLTGAFMAA